MLKAITRRASSVDDKVRSMNAKRASARPALEPISVAHFFDNVASAEDTEVLVGEQDFLDAIAELVPSVSAKELEHYQKVRAVFETGDDGNGAGPKNSNGKGPRRSRNVPTPFLSPGAHPENPFDIVKATGAIDLEDQHGENGLSTVNGHGRSISPARMSKGKGKGKARVDHSDAHDFGFGKAVDDKEELYSP